MNRTKNSISQYLLGLTNISSPIKQTCEKYLKYCCIINSDLSQDIKGNIIPYFEKIRIGHNPAPHWDSYIISLYKGVNNNWFDKFKEKMKIDIPNIYKEFLLDINGCKLFDLFADDMILYGLVPENYHPTDYFLDGKAIKRPKYSGWDLEKANTEWKIEYNFDGFLIGHRCYNWEQEYFGFFIKNNKIFSVNRYDKTIVKYNNFSEFLSEEIKLAEKYYFSKCKEEDLC